MKLIGREHELNRAALFLDRARNERVARILRITGSSGNGKTALCREIQGRAAGEWLAVYLAAHRIQSALPLVVARRLAEEIVRALGDEGGRYSSGLESALAASDADPKAFESALLRLIEGVLHDRALLLIVDDVQWADAESRALIPRILQNFADRPFVLTISERSDESSDTAIDLTDEAIVVEELNAQAASQLARETMPGASDDVIAAVVDHALGRPIDIATIASLSSEYASMTPEDVAASARAIVARNLASAKAPLREFLQICSLIGDPIDYELLRTMWPERELLEFIAAASGRFVIEEGGLRFVHSAVEQSIRETIPIEIPYRKRIMSALESMEVKTPQRYEMLIEQASACGDRALEFRYSMELAAEATRGNAHALVASALERAIPIAPAETDLLPLYQQLTMMYNLLTRDDGIRVARQALEYADAHGRRAGTGPIVAALLFSLWHNSDRADFYNALKRYETQLDNPQDRSQVLGPKLYAALCERDEATFDNVLAELKGLGAEHPIHDARRLVFRGMLDGRAGRLDEGRTALREARAVVEQHGLGPIMIMVTSAEYIYALHARGVNNDELRRPLQALERHEGHRASAEALEMLAVGAPQDAMERIVESYVHQNAPFARRIMLGVAGAVAALSAVPLPQFLTSDIEKEVNAADAPTLAPVLSVAAALSNDAGDASRFARRALNIARSKFEPQILWLPIVLARAAARLQDRQLLEQLIALEPQDHFPWTVAHHRFARYTALHALKKNSDDAQLLMRSFKELGASYFADLVQALGARAEAPKSQESSLLTRREREVAELVASGKSNREIAESLVLSERTVEGHIANIFGKLNVGSRAQIATWYVKSV